MNRIIIKLDSNGNLDGVCCDEDVRVFVYDPTANNEPVYELSVSKSVGVQHVAEVLKNHLAATLDSSGPWKSTKRDLEVI